MKKLMTMISAVAVAFGLQAAESVAPEDSGFKSGSDFEENGVGYAVTNSAYWTIPEGSASVIDGKHEKVDAARPNAFIDAKDSKVLKISSSLGTAGDEVVLNVNANGLVQDIGNGLYFDGLVKMSVFDADDKPVVPKGAKFAAYLQTQDEEAADTDAAPLVVETKTGTFVTATSLAATDWHRLTVKMIANVYAQGEDVVPGFVVFVDGQRISCVDARIVDDSVLTPTAKFYNEGGTLFLSKVAIDSVSSIAFDGQGELGEVAFTTAAPSFAVDPSIASYVVTWDAGVTGFMFNDVKVVGLTGAGSRTFTVQDDGVTPTITDITYAAGKMAGTLNIGDTEATITSQDCAATVTIDGQATPYASIDDAITAINATPSVVTLKLDSAVTADIVVANASAEGVITLDLAGQTLTGKTNTSSSYAIYLQAGKLVVTDTSVEQTGRVVGNVSSAAGDITLAAGIYDGEIYLDGSSQAITGGKFNAKRNAFKDLSEYLEEGQTLVLGEDGYFVLGAASVDVAFSVKSADHVEAKIFIDEALVEGDIPETLTAGQKYKVTFTAANGYQFAEDAQTEFEGTAKADAIAIEAPTVTTIAYTIKYSWIGVEDTDAKIENKNPATYTIEDAITFTAPTCEGYTFKSFNVAGIELGSTGDRTVTGTFEKSSMPTVDPVAPGETTYETEDAAAAAAAAINANKTDLITVPEGVTDKDKAAYAALFEATANGKTVTVGLTAEAKADIQTQVDGDLKKVDVAGIAAAETSETELSITAKPGLFYSVEQGETLGAMTEGERVMAKGTTVQLKATKYSGSGFYKILVNTSDKK